MRVLGFARVLFRIQGLGFGGLGFYARVPLYIVLGTVR